MRTTATGIDYEVEWYIEEMSGTQTIVMGDRGRLVVPAGLRARQHWSRGTALVAVETSSGVLLTRRDELERIVAAQLAGRDVVSELIEERRSAARVEAE